MSQDFFFGRQRKRSALVTNGDRAVCCRRNLLQLKLDRHASAQLLIDRKHAAFGDVLHQIGLSSTSATHYHHLRQTELNRGRQLRVEVSQRGTKFGKAPV